MEVALATNILAYAEGVNGLATKKVALPTPKQTQLSLEAAARNYAAMVRNIGKHRDSLLLISQLGISGIFDQSGNWPSTLQPSD